LEGSSIGGAIGIYWGLVQVGRTTTSGAVCVLIVMDRQTITEERTKTGQENIGLSIIKK